MLWGYQSRWLFEIRALKERHHEFQLMPAPRHRYRPRYHSDGLSPVLITFRFFSQQIYNVAMLFYHFHKNIKHLTQFLFPLDPDMFWYMHYFYRHYTLLHHLRKDLVLCSLRRQNFLNFLKFWNQQPSICKSVTFYYCILLWRGDREVQRSVHQMQKSQKSATFT